MKPDQKVPVLIILNNGEVREGHWLKDINKYERNVNRWRIYKTGKTVPDEEVVAWAYIDELKHADDNTLTVQIHYNIDL